MTTERSIKELQGASSWTDEELDRLLGALSTAEAAITPLGSHFALARDEIVRRLEAAKSTHWHRTNSHFVRTTP
jgi:hypothetical protein